MPLIMDDPSYNMDVDDLFGDTEQVPLPTIAAPPVKGLAGRLDELSASGCCQKIAWSKNGCVAYISPDGASVYLRVFSRDSTTGKWDLGDDILLEIPSEHDTAPYVHMSFSHLGNDLAVMNTTGHVIIFSCQMTLDRMSFAKVDLSQPEVDIDAVVGIHWLAIYPHEQKNHITWSATGKDNDWNFHTSSHMFQDAHHPMDSKASMLYLKRQGELRLRFQQVDSSWQEASASLGPALSTRDVFTHAAFASNNDNTLLLAAYDVAGRLHHYQVEAKWNIPPPKPGQPPQRFEKPELLVTSLGVEDDCFPISTAAVNGDLNGSPESKIRIPAQLTHLNFLPRTPEQNDETVPTIQAIFSTPPNIVSFDQTQPQQYPSSILVRWEVHPMQRHQLHSSLDKVTSKRKSVSSVPAKEILVLKRLPDIVLHSVVVAFYPVWYNMLLAFCYSDGTIDFRRRATMDQIMADFNTETVTSLVQAGFAFPPLDPSLHVAFSPNHCMAACMQPDGTIKLRSMEYTYGSLASDEADSKHSAALAALVLQSSSAGNQYFSSDDLFSIMGALSPQRKNDFIYLMFQGLNVNIDCGTDDNTNNHLLLLGRSPLFVKTLSAAHLLGLEGSIQRSVSSKISWMILNIKYITQILTTIARMHGQIDKNPLRPEIVPQFVGICRWIMHFMTYMIDELFALGFALKEATNPPSSSTTTTTTTTITDPPPPSNPLTLPLLNTTLTTLNKPALILLLSSFPRMMMKLWAQPLAWVIRTAFQYSTSAPSPEVRRIYAPLHHALSELPFDWRLFEGLVSEAQQLVRQTYKRGNLSEAQRNEVERELILGRVPDVLFPAARRLVGETLFGDPLASLNAPGGGEGSGRELVEKIDLARVLFFDTTWLGLTASRKAVKWFDAHVVDVCQKSVIRGKGATDTPVSHSVTASSSAGRNRSDSIGTNDGIGGRDGIAAGGGDPRKRKLRKCVRCGAYMDDVMQGMPGYAHHHVSWLMGVAKHCVCGNSWMLSPGKDLVGGSGRKEGV